jgi:hypothetical protein
MIRHISLLLAFVYFQSTLPLLWLSQRVELGPIAFFSLYLAGSIFKKAKKENKFFWLRTWSIKISWPYGHSFQHEVEQQ